MVNRLMCWLLGHSGGMIVSVGLTYSAGGWIGVKCDRCGQEYEAWEYSPVQPVGQRHD